MRCAWKDAEQLKSYTLYSECTMESKCLARSSFRTFALPKPKTDNSLAQDGLSSYAPPCLSNRFRSIAKFLKFVLKLADLHESKIKTYNSE